jgi:hypothetical protein
MRSWMSAEWAGFGERGFRDLDLAVMHSPSLMNRCPPLQYQATATTKAVMTVTLAKAVAGGVVLGLSSRLTGANRNENQCALLRVNGGVTL